MDEWLNGRINGWMAPACCSAVVLLVAEKTPSPTLDLASTERRNGKGNRGMDGWNGWMEREREREKGRKTRREIERESGRGRKMEEKRTLKPIQNTKFAPQQKNSLADKRLTSADKHEPCVVLTTCIKCLSRFRTNLSQLTILHQITKNAIGLMVFL